MSNLTKEQKELLIPSNPVIKEATLKAFKKFNGMDMVAVENFLSKVESTDLPTIPAKASVVFGAIFGHVSVQPTQDYKNCKFETDFWGGGIIGVESIGLLFTAYDKWEAFFANVTHFHIQSIADFGGILQVTFALSNGTPVGQFNGVAIGIGILEGGGPGKWSCS